MFSVLAQGFGPALFYFMLFLFSLKSQTFLQHDQHLQSRLKTASPARSHAPAWERIHLAQQ